MESNPIKKDECEGNICHQLTYLRTVSCPHLTRECKLMDGCYDFTCNKKQTGISIPFKKVYTGLTIYPDSFNEEEK